MTKSCRASVTTNRAEDLCSIGVLADSGRGHNLAFAGSKVKHLRLTCVSPVVHARSPTIESTWRSESRVILIRYLWASSGLRCCRRVETDLPAIAEHRLAAIEIDPAE